MVNETFANFYFKGASPLGRMFARGTGKPDITIVGLVKDSNRGDMDEQPRRVFYMPYRQLEASRRLTGSEPAGLRSQDDGSANRGEPLSPTS